MSQATDEQLVFAARAGDQAARDQLLRRHTPLIYRLIRDWRVLEWVSHDDAEQTAWLAMLRAIELWDPAHGSRFSTYAWAAITNNLRKLIRRETRWWARHSLHDEWHIITGRGQSQSDVDLIEMLGQLHPVARQIVELRHGIGCAAGNASWHTIARQIGLPVPKARAIYMTAMAQLRRWQDVTGQEHDQV